MGIVGLIYILYTQCMPIPSGEGARGNWNVYVRKEGIRFNLNIGIFSFRNTLCIAKSKMPSLDRTILLLGNMKCNKILN